VGPGVVVPGVVVPGVVVGGRASAPEAAVTVAGPERLSEIRRLRAIPRRVRVSRSTWPSVVVQRTTVPSGTSVPAGSITNAISSETPPCEGMNVGFATSVIVDPGGAVRYAPPPQLSRRTAIATAAAVVLTARP
jgi:hypothetical protein